MMTEPKVKHVLGTGPWLVLGIEGGDFRFIGLERTSERAALWLEGANAHNRRVVSLPRILAADDLLAACKIAKTDLEAWIRSHRDDEPENDAAWCHLKAAIAKAEP